MRNVLLSTGSGSGIKNLDAKEQRGKGLIKKAKNTPLPLLILCVLCVEIFHYRFKKIEEL
jgi:hypothetical protein